jgi:hypothetical protein
LGWFSDDVNHILVEVHHGCCSRAVTRGLEMCVLDVVNAWSFTGSGLGSFCRGPLHWIHGWGLAYGIYAWISTLAMKDLMGGRFWVGC